jgi:hypothetical protein
MDAPGLLRLAFNDLHTEIMEDAGGLDDQDQFWQPAPGVNHIGFLLWHIVRDEDTVICQSVRRTPELWVRGNWTDRFAMDATAQGTGFESAELATFRYSLTDLLAYARDVWAQTDEALQSLDPARLDEPLSWSKEWKLANLLTTGCLSHGWVHLGEIRQLRGLRGWRFRE